jgi:hypothetical protein
MHAADGSILDTRGRSAINPVNDISEASAILAASGLKRAYHWI